MDKPFHLMTAAERTALRIAQNRAIAEKVEQQKRAEEREGKPAKPPRRSAAAGNSSPRIAPQPPPKQSTNEFIRATPEERARLGSFIRKVQS